MDNGSWKPEAARVEDESRMWMPDPVLDHTTPNEFVEERTVQMAAHGPGCGILNLCGLTSCGFCANLFPSEPPAEHYRTMSSPPNLPALWRTVITSTAARPPRRSRTFAIYAATVFVAAAAAIVFFFARNVHGAELADSDVELYGLAQPAAPAPGPVNLLGFLRPVFVQVPAAPYDRPAGPARASLAAPGCAEDDAPCLQRFDFERLVDCRFREDVSACDGAAFPAVCRADCLAMDERLEDRPVDPCTWVVKIVGQTATISRQGLLRSQDVPARAGWRAGAFVGQCPPPPPSEAQEREEAAFAVWFGRPSQTAATQGRREVRLIESLGGGGGRP